jgi:hypothetical protein
MIFYIKISNSFNTIISTLFDNNIYNLSHLSPNERLTILILFMIILKTLLILFNYVKYDTFDIILLILSSVLLLIFVQQKQLFNKPSKGFGIIQKLLGDFMIEGILSERQKNRLRFVELSDFNILSKIFFQQIQLNCDKRETYVIDINTGSEQSVLHNNNNNNKRLVHNLHDLQIQQYINNLKTFNIITVAQNTVTLSCIRPSDLIIFITKCNYFNRYIMIPITVDYGTDVGHFSGIVFDKIEFKVYYIDPNGCTNLFVNKKNKSIIESEKLVDKLLLLYISDINKLLIKSGKNTYQYIIRTIWNSQMVGMNYLFENSVIGSGYCVICTIFMMHYLAKSKVDVTEMVKIVGMLSEYEIKKIINNYSCKVIQYFPDNKFI